MCEYIDYLLGTLGVNANALPHCMLRHVFVLWPYSMDILLIRDDVQRVAIGRRC